MKRIFFIAMISLLAISIGNSQTTEAQWREMIQTAQTSIDNALIRDCPTGVDLNTYKLRLLKGEAVLTEEARLKIAAQQAELVKYGQEVAVKNNLDYEDETDLIIYCMFSPNADLSNGEFSPQAVAGRMAGDGLTWDEVLYCAGVAIGADAVYALTQSGASSWSVGTIKRVFKSVAKRFLGPVGVVVATISFGGCLITQGFD